MLLTEEKSEDASTDHGRRGNWTVGGGTSMTCYYEPALAPFCFKYAGTGDLADCFARPILDEVPATLELPTCRPATALWPRYRCLAIAAA